MSVDLPLRRNQSLDDEDQVAVRTVHHNAAVVHLDDFLVVGADDQSFVVPISANSLTMTATSGPAGSTGCGSAASVLAGTEIAGEHGVT